MTWPNDFPKDVPPSDAIELDGIYFRFVDNQNISEIDFLPTYKDPEQRKIYLKNQGKAEVYAVSFMQTEESIRTMQIELPKRFSKKLIARGKLIPNYGKGKMTGRPFHMSVWFYDGVSPQGFKII